MVIDVAIAFALLVTGLVNSYMNERTERKAFLEIRTCMESRHLIAKENQNQVWLQTLLPVHAAV